ncbi:hypothetical protein D9758_007433 [Tetrapyrgos nigripes]|uniref:Uncharacterized protein n=1 Tax=Tetrapyrgos nigripes TaxID=182062 RepID=A0A8H5LHS0_9AGAR|nr:hypothetical protein D9758_007433 [Tetrapyrgos nigripes]
MSGSKSSETSKQSKPESKGHFCPCGEQILFLKYDALSDPPEELLNTNEPLLDSLYAQEARHDIRAAKEMKKILAAHRERLYNWTSILLDEEYQHLHQLAQEFHLSHEKRTLRDHSQRSLMSIWIHMV